MAVVNSVVVAMAMAVAVVAAMAAAVVVGTTIPASTRSPTGSLLEIAKRNGRKDQTCTRCRMERGKACTSCTDGRNERRKVDQ